MTTNNDIPEHLKKFAKTYVAHDPWNAEKEHTLEMLYLVDDDADQFVTDATFRASAIACRPISLKMSRDFQPTEEAMSVLGSVRRLSLVGCANLVDVSALSKVHTLNIAACPNVVDVSALSNVQNLNMEYCFGVKNISALRNVPTLSLRGSDIPGGSRKYCYGSNEPRDDVEIL